ncbi:MAG TPA: VWA domain-containing protein [Blastocatellia bacterium]|nr:VWA domain-containing protein [Blastocatellia bacterium]
MEQVVSFLFKYRGGVFSKGRIAFGASPGVLALALIVTALGVAIYFAYFRKASKLNSAARPVLIALRSVLFLVILFCLMRPTVVVPSVVPQSSFAAVLMDNSASTKIADQNNLPRLDAEKSLMAPDSVFYKSLSGRFKVRQFEFASDVKSISAASELNGEGDRTNLAGGLNQISREMAGDPVSGIVLMTDGANNTAGDIGNTLATLKSRGVPVYVVGLGSTTLDGDLELVRATAPARVLAGSPISAELEVRATGTGDRAVKVEVGEDGHPLESQDIAVHGSDATQVVRLRFTPTSAGVHSYKFTLAPLPGEKITANNSGQIVVNVENSRPRILYVEGEPRWEYGKIHEAMYEEKNLQLVSLLRSADGKFYRQGVDDPNELATGFPKSAEDLFKYDGILLGSAEATFFTFDQLRNIEEFVSRRGGGFLALGGANSFDNGNYINTPLADLLPVYLTGQATKDWESQTFKVAPSTREQDSPVARLAERPEANAKAWQDLPAVTLPEVFYNLKPGATEILEAHSLRDPNARPPVLAEERYGRGRSMAFMVSDTWRWRMMLDSSNTTFETFWRNLLRYEIQNVRHQTEVSTERSFYATGDEVSVRADVADTKYQDVTTANVLAHVSAPSGRGFDLQLKPSFGQDFNGYRASFVPDEEGEYTISVKAERSASTKDAGPLEGAETTILAGKIDREAFGAAQNQELLRRIATETGGGYYTPDTAVNLVEDMSHSGAGDSVQTAYDLWDMPINFLLVVALASAEWFLRKRMGLA